VGNGLFFMFEMMGRGRRYDELFGHLPRNTMVFYLHESSMASTSIKLGKIVDSGDMWGMDSFSCLKQWEGAEGMMNCLGISQGTPRCLSLSSYLPLTGPCLCGQPVA